MSDSFADLWNSTAPSNPAQPTQARTLGSITPAVQQQRGPTNDVFSMLASSSSNSTRSTTPSYVSSPLLTKAGSTGGITLAGGAKAIQKVSSNGQDAFSDLFSGSFASNSNNSNLTIAQKAAIADKQRLGQQSQGRTRSTQAVTTDSAWAGLDSLGTSSFTAARTSSTPPQPTPAQDDWIFDSIHPAAPAPSASKVQSSKNDDDWGLDDFVSEPKPKRPSQATSQSLWDIDDLASPSSALAAKPALPAQNGRSSTPGSFDFGDREYGLLDDPSGDEDDILGALGKPAQSKPLSSVCDQELFPCSDSHPPLACSSYKRSSFSSAALVRRAIACCVPSASYPRTNR